MTKVPAEKKQQNKTTANGETYASTTASPSGTSPVFIDNRPEAIAQRQLQRAMQQSPLQQPLKARQQMMNAPIQLKRISRRQLENGGFTGPHQGGSWQWNVPRSGGIHVTVIRQNGIATHFHVRRDTQGNVHNRIDYNEGADGAWAQGNTNVPAGDELQAQMEAIGQQMIQWIRGLAAVQE